MENKQEIFLKLLEQHRGILIKVSKIYMDNLEDQQDLQQEIVFQLWKSYAHFGGKSKFSTWMYRVALNTAITYFKKDKRRVDNNRMSEKIEMKAEDENENNLSREIGKETQLTYFYKAVKKLNKIEKAIILLFIEGQSHKEISKNLGLTEINARVKLNRTKKKIQVLIKELGYEF